MMRMAFLLVVMVVCATHPSAYSQTIRSQFPNLFRGSRRPTNQDNNDDPLNFVVTIQPMATGETTELPNSGGFQEGLIKLRDDVWNQEEIELQLFPGQRDQDRSSRFRFRQSPANQPKPDMFYGTTARESEEDEEDSISLIQSTVTSSRIPVVTGSIHVRGLLYQIRQLPSGDIVVQQRRQDDFEDEFEIEDEDDIEAWVAPDLPGNKDALEVDDTLDPRRLLPVVTEASSRNSSSLELTSDATNPYNRRMQGNDDGSRLDIMVRIVSYDIVLSATNLSRDS
jgi:hypothetical protein